MESEDTTPQSKFWGRIGVVVIIVLMVAAPVLYSSNLFLPSRTLHFIGGPKTRHPHKDHGSNYSRYPPPIVEHDDGEEDGDDASSKNELLLERIEKGIDMTKNIKQKIRLYYDLDNHPKLFDDFWVPKLSQGLFSIKQLESLVELDNPFVMVFTGTSVFGFFFNSSF